ncbi:MAG: HU family DNA-binding protein [Balneolaceae bacterium]|jgi:DNA-binding protein HU-beta/integration host factor subunit alpha|nr:HU family DNA-binding protein [Balneolaceae bacterium]MCR9131027.1 HU family DNA-binding protein [bacterium]
MGKIDTIRQLSERTGFTQQETERIYNRLVDILSDHLANDEGFTLPKIGSFHSRIRDSYQTYNPHYKGMIQLPKKKVVQFTQSTTLKDELNEGK